MTVAASAVAVLALSGTGCSVDKPSADKCRSVSAELADIPTRTDQEPKMRIPIPAGWERTTEAEKDPVRFAIRNRGLTAQEFVPNAVVTLQKAGLDIGKPDQILQIQNDQLAKKLKATDLNSQSTDVCGSPALWSTYTAPEVKMGKKLPTIPPRKATSIGVVYRAKDANYVATLTVQTVQPDNETYVKDSETILKGFQLLPPG